MCTCARVFFLIQIDRMLRRLCAHYNYTHLRNVGSLYWRGGCNQRSLCHTHTRTRTHLTFLQRLATHLFALESNLGMKKISQVYTHSHTQTHSHIQRKHHCHHRHHQWQLLSYHQICHHHHYHHHLHRCMLMAAIFVYYFSQEIVKYKSICMCMHLHTHTHPHREITVSLIWTFANPHTIFKFMLRLRK